MKRLSVILITCFLVLALSLPAFALDTSRSYSFELIADGSVSVTTGYQSGLRHMEDSTYAKVLMNFVSSAMDGQIQDASVLVGSFQLKAIAAGTTTVKNDDYYCTTQTGTAKYASTASGLSVTIASSSVTLSGISAVFNQGSTAVYTSTALNSLKPMLTVTAHYSDGSSAALASNDYSLSGTLAVGTSTVTVTYNDKTTTFNVTVTESGGGSGGGDTSSGVEGAKETATFTDVPSTAWYYDAVEYVVTNGLLTGTTATTFEPQAIMTRGMLVQVLYVWRANHL